MKKVFALILSIIMALSLTACGGKNPLPNGSKAPDGQTSMSGSDEEKKDTASADKGSSMTRIDSYEDAYTFYTKLIDCLEDEIPDIIEANNKRLEEENPDGAYSDPSYYMIAMYMPFTSLDMAFTSSISDDTDPSTIAMMYGIMGIADAKYEKVGKGKYRITYTLNGSDGTNPKQAEDLMWYADGSIRYQQVIDGKTDEFSEFISLGSDRYALQNATNRAIVTYRDGKIVELVHSATLYDFDWETNEPKEWSVSYDAEADSIWGKTSMDESWVRELEAQGALRRIYALKDGVLTISGQKDKTNWETGETTFSAMDPIVISE